MRTHPCYTPAVISKDREAFLCARLIQPFLHGMLEQSIIRGHSRVWIVEWYQMPTVISVVDELSPVAA